MNPRSIMRLAVPFVLLVFMVIGCALQTAPPPASPSPPAAQPPANTQSQPPGSQVGTTASGGTIRVNPADSLPPMPAPRDSTPSPDALEVLASIPEPLGRPSETAAPPRTETRATPSVPGPAAAARDTVEGRGGAAPDTTDIPVPAPTTPLGDRPGSRVSIPDSAVAPASPPPPSPAPPSTPPGAAPAPSGPEPCWRVQVAAKPERPRSERLMAAAQSQLEVPWVIEREDGLYKVRTRDCFSEAAAEALRRRAIAAGFEGTFKVKKR